LRARGDRDSFICKEPSGQWPAQALAIRSGLIPLVFATPAIQRQMRHQMFQRVRQDGVFPAMSGAAWPVFAVALAAAAGWGAYHWLGDMDTPVRKASVVAATLAGFGVAVWFNRFVRMTVYSGLVILLIWAVGLWLSK